MTTPLQKLANRKGAFLRLFLGVAMLLAITVLIFPFFVKGPKEVETWAVVAAALAVLASIISAWTSQRIVELEESKQRPYPYPFIDDKSRYQLLELRVTNFGTQAAHDIYLRWNAPMTNFKGQRIAFSNTSGGPDIAILLPGHSVASTIGVAREVFKDPGHMAYDGTVEFRDDFGRKYTYPFCVSLEQYRNTLLYDTEESRTQFELQKIPELLKDLTDELGRLRSDLRGET